MSELLKEYDEHSKKKEARQNLIKTIMLSFVAIIVAIYFGNMFFGKSSLDVLLSLKQEQRNLENKIDVLKAKNAQAQKEYLQLLRLKGANVEN
ncbi:hypothetical protein FVD15_06705 [Campylobacter volucris]|uniref:Septum formation initiator n=3 Tax=Campylobacter volucris TaxID=1031542 RepID=A0AAF1D1M5_9BACT|nr:hypothetical protein F7P61_05100 [Campylobacter volucris]MBF7042555.1 hypothetical protein [Campylobacter volucris]MBF7044205.1 hypothetical protein [Campylobacter volucris]MBF7045431.1 hypothetical protein [Campylobacter volucris]MBF7047360.1 hypothetical protein [Campylobacter volucris]